MASTGADPAKRKPKRRDDGDGSVYQLRDGRWQAQLTIGWVRDPTTGRQRRIRRYGDAASKQGAKVQLDKLLAEHAAGRLPIGEAVTVGHWLNYWLEYIAPRRCVAKTLEGYETQIRHWIIPTLGHIRLVDLQPEHVEQLHDAMFAGKARTRSNGRTVPARPLSGSTVRLAHRTLSRALTVAVQRGKLPRNPASLVDLPRGKDVAITHAEYLCAEDARAVLTTCAGRWDEARWAVGLALGLRPGERLGLLWDEDVDLAAEVINVQRQLQRRRAANGQKGRLELVHRTKSRKRRPIAIPPQLLAVLKAHRRRQLERRLAIGDEWQQSPLGDLVFTDERGHALDPRRDWEAWRDLLAEAGVPYVKPHGSRHTAASLMLLQGVDVKIVADILGHASTQITQDIYQHVAPQLVRAAVATVGDVLWADRASATASATAGNTSEHQRTAKVRKSRVTDISEHQRTG